MPHAPIRVVICGAGVIGAAIAYYLSLRGVAATIVERCGVACAASGKAGGFLALDWCDNSRLAALARTSFTLHVDLAQTLGTDYGYRRLTILAVTAAFHGNAPFRNGLERTQHYPTTYGRNPRTGPVCGLCLRDGRKV